MTSVAERGPPGPRPLSRRRLAGLLVSFVLLGALTVLRLSGDPTGTEHHFTGPTMGTSYQVTVDAELTASERAEVRDVIVARLDRVNRLMSTYDSTSELSRFNRHASVAPFPVSTELLEVLTMAMDVSERSGGAFDVTVAPLVDAWGFGPVGRPTHAPDEETLSELGAVVGYGQLVLDPTAGTIAKRTPETVVDLSAIAKGYGVEHVAEGLRELRLTSFLVEIGGELKAVGTRLDGRPWHVGIERPDETSRSVFGVIELVDQSVATSGDYRNFYEEDGVRYAHVIDPRTGMPIRFHGASVSVAHPNAAMADAWATALTVLGPDAGYELARGENVAALFVIRANEAVRSRATPLFPGLLETSGGEIR